MIACNCINSNGPFGWMSFLYTGPLYAKEGLALLPVTRPLGTVLSVQSHWHAKEPWYFCLTFKEGITPSYWGLMSKAFQLFSWFLEVVQVDWKDGKVREWIERLLTALRLVLWGTSGNNVLTVSQGPALLYCIATWVSWVGFFQMFLSFSLESSNL